MFTGLGTPAKATVQEQELVARDHESAVFRNKLTPAKTQAEDDPIPGNLKLNFFDVFPSPLI